MTAERSVRANGLPGAIRLFLRSPQGIGLQADALHDALQGGLHGIGLGQLGGRFAVAVAAVHRLVMGQHTEELQAVSMPKHEQVQL